MQSHVEKEKGYGSLCGCIKDKHMREREEISSCLSPNNERNGFWNWANSVWLSEKQWTHMTHLTLLSHSKTLVLAFTCNSLSPVTIAMSLWFLPLHVVVSLSKSLYLFNPLMGINRGGWSELWEEKFTKMETKKKPHGFCLNWEVPRYGAEKAMYGYCLERERIQ